jgi:hypothetical protein
LSVRALQYIVAEPGKQAGLPEELSHPHALRHATGQKPSPMPRARLTQPSPPTMTRRTSRAARPIATLRLNRTVSRLQTSRARRTMNSSLASVRSPHSNMNGCE